MFISFFCLFTKKKVNRRNKIYTNQIYGSTYVGSHDVQHVSNGHVISPLQSATSFVNVPVCNSDDPSGFTLLHISSGIVPTISLPCNSNSDNSDNCPRDD